MNLQLEHVPGLVQKENASAIHPRDFQRRIKAQAQAMGQAGSPLVMKYVLSSGRIKEGDMIVTSGMSENFPKGIPIGKVSKAVNRSFDLFLQVEIKPSVDLGKLEDVFVIRK